MKVTTLNIGLNYIKYLVFRDASAVAWGSVPLAGAVKNGIILQPENTGEQLRSLFVSGKLPGEKVICSINGLPFTYRYVTLPRMNPSSLKEALSRLARQEMPLAPEDMYLSWRAYPAEKGEWQFLVMGVTRHSIDALIKMTSAAGVTPYLMCLPHISLAALADRDNAIMVDFGPDCSNITLVVRGVPVGMHTVPTPDPEANLQDKTGQLIREITRMAGFYNDNHPKNPIPEMTTVLLTGDLSSEPETVKLLQEGTGYPAELLKQPLTDKVKLPSEFPFSLFAINVGDVLQDEIIDGATGKNLALCRDLNIRNIIDERTGGRKTGGILKPLLLSAVLTIGIGALVAAYIFQTQAGVKATQLQSELRQAHQQLVQMQAAASLAVQTENDINKILSSARLIEQQNQSLLNPRDNVSDLNFLTQSLPPATSFSTIEVNVNQITMDGTTAAPERVIEFVRKLELSAKFTAVDIVWINRSANSGNNMGIGFLITIKK
jgi:Tfp pilus assembly PilM family ATPase/Tfp pilus assembly protein PilN